MEIDTNKYFRVKKKKGKGNVSWKLIGKRKKCKKIKKIGGVEYILIKERQSAVSGYSPSGREARYPRREEGSS